MLRQIVMRVVAGVMSTVMSVVVLAMFGLVVVA
jgi:hypothetical protein